MLHCVANAVDDLDGVGAAALLEDGDVDGMLAVYADDVGLQLAGVLRGADIADEDGGSARGLDGHCVDLLDHWDLTVGVDVVILRADTDVAGWEDQIRFVDRMDDVHDGELVCFEFHWIDVDLNLAILSAIRLWHRCAGDIRHLIADGELGEIFELGLVKALAFERDQADRQVRRVELEHDGRQRAGRQAAQVGHGEIGDVGDGGVGVGAGLEVDLDERDAG